MDEYVNNISKEIDKEMSDNFKNKTVNKIRIKRVTEKNLLEQEILGAMFSNRNKSNSDRDPIDINKINKIEKDD
jgi:hypothetical protein